eukprot:8539713-Karenia_brevis.AAC.1
MQEKESDEGDAVLREWNMDLFGEESPDIKRKEEGDDKEVPEGKRRRTQEEEDWYDEFWDDKDKP